MNNYYDHFNEKILELPPTSNPSGICPNDFEELPDVTDSSFCYKIISDSLPWQNASNVCESSGSYLVSILSKEENDALYNAISYGADVWLGLQDNREFYLIWIRHTLL